MSMNNLHTAIKPECGYSRTFLAYLYNLVRSEIAHSNNKNQIIELLVNYYKKGTLLEF